MTDSTSLIGLMQRRSEILAKLERCESGRIKHYDLSGPGGSKLEDTKYAQQLRDQLKDIDQAIAKEKSRQAA